MWIEFDEMILNPDTGAIFYRDGNCEVPHQIRYRPHDIFYDSEDDEMISERPDYLSESFSDDDEMESRFEELKKLLIKGNER